jgi:hypothetical protein
MAKQARARDIARALAAAAAAPEAAAAALVPRPWPLGRAPRARRRLARFPLTRLFSAAALRRSGPVVLSFRPSGSTAPAGGRSAKPQARSKTLADARSEGEKGGEGVKRGAVPPGGGAWRRWRRTGPGVVHYRAA